MIATYLPFEWQKEIRKKAEDIPEQQFNYLLSTLAIATSAITGGTVAYTLWPYLRGTVIWLFSADAVEARVLQVNIGPCLMDSHLTHLQHVTVHVIWACMKLAVQ